MTERTIQQLVDRLNSSDPDFDDCTDAAIILMRQHAEIERLTAERDAAIANASALTHHLAQVIGDHGAADGVRCRLSRGAGSRA